MKKSFSLILAIALVFSMFTPMAFAADQSAGEYLAEIGVISGSLSGDLMENETWKRQDVTVILSRLVGAEDEAKATPKSHTYADVTDPFYDGYISWAKENGYFQGHSDVRFGYDEPITKYDFLAVMLRALGVDTKGANYANVPELAVEAGLITSADEDLNVEATRGEYYGVIITTLNAEVEEGVTLGAKLGLPGFVVDEPAALAVDSVEAPGYTHIVVTYNEDVEDNAEAAKTGNYTLSKGAVKAVAVEGSTAVLYVDKDGNTDAIDKFDQQETITLTIKKEVTGEEVKKDVTFLDTTLPKALSATAVGNDTIKVTFSEPMNPATFVNSNFVVDGGNYYIKEVQATNNNLEANVVLYSSLEEGTIEIEVKKEVEDFAGFGIIATTLEAVVVEDKEAPVVVDYKDATPNGVTLIFNEEIEINTTSTDDFYHTNASNTVTTLPTFAPASSGKELKLDFSDANLPAGTAYVYINANAVNDLWDNKNSKIVVEIKVTVDTEAPYATEITVVNEEKITVTFNEDVTNPEADDFKVLDSDGKEVENIISSVALNGTKKIDINFSKKLSGDHALVIKGVEDLAGNESKEQVIEFTVNDMTAPEFGNFEAKLYNAGRSNQMIRITFGEAMNTSGKYSVADKDNYVIFGDNLSDIEDATLTVVDGGKAVEIKIPASKKTLTFVDSNNDGIHDTASDITLARVADAAGNYTAALSGTVALKNQGYVDFTAELTNKNTIVVKFSDELAKFDANDLIVFADNTVSSDVYQDGDTKLVVSRVTSALVGGKTQITLTLHKDNEASTNGTYKGSDIKVSVIGDQTKVVSNNRYGEKLEADDVAVVADKAAPVVSKIARIDATTIVVEFSEDLDADYFAQSGTNGFSVTGGGSLTKASLSDTHANRVVLEGSNFTINTNVHYNGAFGLVDTEGNKIASFDHTAQLKDSL